MATEKAYASNIAKAWPVERQREMLAGRGHLYEDRLGKKAIRDKRVPDLEERALLVKPTSRRGSEERVTVAALPCLAFDAPDLMTWLAAAAKRNITVHVLDIDLTIPPHAEASEAYARALDCFLTAKRRAQTDPARGAGSKKREELAADMRADTLRRIELIRDDWPRQTPPTRELLARAGRGNRPMAYATAAEHLGKRPDAQRKYERLMAKEKPDA